MKIHIYVSLFLLLLTMHASGQDTLRFTETEFQDSVSAIRVITEFRGDSMVVRWAPTDVQSWSTISNHGVWMSRYELDASGMPNTNAEVKKQIRPWTEQEFEIRQDNLSDHLLGAAHVLYGENESETDRKSLFEQQQEWTNRFGVALLLADLEPLAANALGLRYVDHNVEKGKVYLYTVNPVDTASLVVRGHSIVPATEMAMAVPVIENILEEEGHVVLLWRKSMHEDHFSAYQVEMANQNGIFSPVNSLPFVGGESNELRSDHFGMRVEIPNYSMKRFRIKGLTPFGIWSPPSAEFSAQARDKTATSQPTQIRVKHDQVNGAVTFTWKDPIEKDFEKIEVITAQSFSGTYRVAKNGVIRKKTELFTDQQTDTRGISYYKLVAVDTAGNRNESRVFEVAFRDTIPPLTPTGLSGEVDSMGIVRLTWNANKENDLEGYMVYMANQEDHFFTNKTPKPISLESWSDTITLKTFTEEIFYRVTAVDFQSHVSTWTEPIKLQKPDTIAPMPPSIKNYRVEKDHIRLTLSPSSSKDVIRHTLSRKRQNENQWMIMTAYKEGQAEYNDYDVEPNITYSYQFVSVDDSGLTCLLPAEISILNVDRSKPVPPQILECSFVDKNVVLKWNQEISFSTITIYRSENDGAFTSLSKVKDGNSYIDERVESGKTYKYKIKAIRSDGIQSAYSSEISPTR